MNLLTDQWIPVRPLDGGTPEKITLQELLCEDGKWDLYLPRDDMELAALQLLICITQALLTPQDANTLRSRIANPITPQAYESAAMPLTDWFQLDHPKHPFMQVRGVAAKETTSMDKLLAGLTGATNSCFVNQPNMAVGLCAGCTAIALFNQASCAPSFGGGFKGSLRGSSPITTLVQGDHLRRTIWLNVLSHEEIQNFFPWHADTVCQKPTWLDPIKARETIRAQQLGFVRGLLWQPANIELCQPADVSTCSCCGFPAQKVFTAFKKEKFNYTIESKWPHPHSPRILSMKKGETKEKFAAFTTSVPAWTQLARFVVQQQISDGITEGQQPAAVILQARKIFGAEKSSRLHLVVGGYRNHQASVLERRHEVFTLNHGWEKNSKVIQHLVLTGRGYRDALKSALFSFENGNKKSAVKGSGIKMNSSIEAQYYRRSEATIQDTLGRIDFENPESVLSRMRKALKQIVVELFDEAVRPYLNDPELIRSRAVARRVLQKHIKDLEPQTDKGGINGTTENP